MGFVLPPVRIQDNMQLARRHYSIRVKEIEAGSGELRPTMLLAMDPKGGTPDAAGRTDAASRRSACRRCGSSRR